jgi:SAM-dependent methyltransferase
LSEAADEPEEPTGFGRPRGPGPRTDSRPATSWDTDDLPVGGEHRDTLAGAEADVAYRLASALCEGRTVLEVGCGSGEGTALMREASRIAAIDPDPEAIARARDLKLANAGFRAGEPLALATGEERFDLVLCFAALESTPEPERLLEVLRRAVADGGILLTALPTAQRYDPISGEPVGEPRDRESWWRALEPMFAELRFLRRRISFAATITDADSAAGGEEIERAIWLGADPAEDRALLVVASDSPLPELPALASIVGARDLRAYRETIAAWEQRARRAEAEGAAKHWELVASREAQRRLRKRLYTLEHRPGRVISRVLRGKPARLGEGPPIRASERDPEPWD